MSSRRFFDRTPDGVTEWFHYDHVTGDCAIETVQDCEPILDVNKTLQNDDDYTKQGMKDEMWHYARIPAVVQVQWLNEYGIDNWPMKPGNEKLLFKLLNSPEWRHLKTTRKMHS
jgi:hypothetical protein